MCLLRSPCHLLLVSVEEIAMTLVKIIVITVVIILSILFLGRFFI
jgi:hypothetical protein